MLLSIVDDIIKGTHVLLSNIDSIPKGVNHVNTYK